MTTEHEGINLSPIEVARAKALANLGKVLQSPDISPLREHQISMLEALFKFFQSGQRTGYFSEPTGVGKSAVMVKAADATGLKTVILSPTQQILDQTYKAAKRFTPHLKITNYDSRSKDLSGNTINTTYQSILRLIDRYRKGQSTGSKIQTPFNPENVELVICDETHLGLGEIRHTIYRDFPNAFLIGMTATPAFAPLEGFVQRGIVKASEDWIGLFKNNIHEMTLEEAMESGILTNLGVHIIRTNIQVGEVVIKSSGEYRQSDLERFFIKKSRNALAIALVAGLGSIPKGVHISEEQKKEIAEINQRISGKRTVVFAISVAHADELTQELNTRGISAAAVHYQIDPEVRTKILESHSRGETQVVIGVDMLRLGWDSPSTEVSIHLRPTRSGIVKVQEVGRILRPSPETGKTEAIAIEFVDLMQKKSQSPILIPNIFDPEYVLRGTRTGKAQSAARKTLYQEKPIITFTGMDIETIVEEARSQELLRSRFRQATVIEMCDLFDKTFQAVYQSNPKAGMYELCQLTIEELPERIPMEAQLTALQALASIDSNTATLAKRAMVLLNLKTLVSAVDYYTNGRDETAEEKDEMIKTAMVAIIDFLPKIKPNVQISQQIYYPAREAIAVYISNRDKAPLELVKHPRYSQIAVEITSALENDTDQSTDAELESLVKELANETGANKEDIRDYVFLRRRLIFEQYEKMAKEGKDSLYETAASEEITYCIDDVLSDLNRRQREAIRLRFGLPTDRVFTFREIAEMLRLNTPEGARQLVEKGLARLRLGPRARRLKWYIQDEALPVSMMDIEPPRYYPSDIRYLMFPNDIEQRLRRSGINDFGDFFSAYPNKIQEEWDGDNTSLASVVEKVTTEVESLIQRLESPDITPSGQDIIQLKELSDAIIYKNAREAIDFLDDREQLVIAQKAGLLEALIPTLHRWGYRVTVERFLKLSPYEFASLEYKARKALVEKGLREFKSYKWLIEERNDDKKDKKPS